MNSTVANRPQVPASALSRVPPQVAAVRVSRKARQLATLVIAICAVAQLAIDISLHNATSVMLAAGASIITFQLVARAQYWRKAPLPTLVVVGFSIATMSGALVAQTLSLRPLIFNLQVPVLTFAACALFQLSLLAALWIFNSSPTLRAGSRAVSRRVLRPMGLLRAPRPSQLWIMGGIGTAAMAWSATVAHTGLVEYGDVGAKLVQGLKYFAYAPFLIPVLSLVFPTEATSKKPKFVLLSAYLGLLVVLGIALNSRSAFVMGVANLGMAAILLTLLGQLQLTRKVRRRLIVAVAAMLLLAPALSDLATAMVVVRGERGETSATELAFRTFEAFRDKESLEEYRQRKVVRSTTGEYGEYYLDNPFLSRFVQTKFFDNTLALDSVRAGQHAGALWRITLDKLAALLPSPALRLIGADLNKADLEFSMGDALYYQQYGTGLGNYRTGSPIGHGLALMGPLVYIAAVPLFIFTFIALQSLTAFGAGIVVISPVALLQLMPIFRLAGLDSLSDPIEMILRGLPQDILIYWILFHGTRLLTELDIGSAKRSRRRRGFRASIPGSADSRQSTAQLQR